MQLRHTLHAVLLAMAFTLAGCDLSAPQEPLLIGTGPWSGYQPLYLARQLGHFDNQPIQLIEYPSNSEVLRAFRDGLINGAALTLDEALTLRENGHRPRVVLVMDISNGADALLARSDITSLAQLRGKRIGVENTALGAYFLSRILTEAGLTPADIEPVSMPVDLHASAFANGQVDAVVTFEPVRTSLLAAGASELFSSAELPNEIMDVLVIDENYLASSPQQVTLLLTGWFDALEQTRQQTSLAVDYAAARLHTPPEAYLQALRGMQHPDLAQNRRLLANHGALLKQTIERLHTVMVEADLLREGIDINAMVAERPLLEMAP